MFHYEIPDHWSAEQALAVYELIDNLVDNIWFQYEDELFQLLRPDMDGLDEPPIRYGCADEIPF